jgi:hypothetical protein
MVRAQAAEDGVAHRDAHAKHHGCVRGTFEIRDGIDPRFAVGVFSSPRSFPAWIRFSNGSGKSQDDAEGDGRGMAIKLMGVDGEKLLDDERDARTQDFVMINHPTFFVRNAVDYVEFQKGLIAGGLGIMKFFFPGLDPRSWRTHEFSITRALTGKKIVSPLRTPYFSMTPYSLGSDRQMKYSVRPCATNPSRILFRFGENFLRENMKKELAESAYCFDFSIQLRSDPASMPIEDPTIEWDEAASPYVPVAKVNIPAQDFSTAAREEFCENLSMTPWHSLPELRPLGGINRVRKAVYRYVSKLRHELNRVVREEPAE